MLQLDKKQVNDLKPKLHIFHAWHVLCLMIHNSLEMAMQITDLFRSVFVEMMRDVFICEVYWRASVRMC